MNFITDNSFMQNSITGKPDLSNLEFGNKVCPHMLVADYDGEWSDSKIVPYSDLTLSPSTLALHYGQTVFEGMKAFHMIDGNINIFRIERHYERFVRSLERMCMAVPPRDMFIEGLKDIVGTDAAWVPPGNGAALYIRPFVYASESRFGVKISDQYKFIIFSGPVPELFSKPIRVKVEQDCTRAAKGGTGFAKCGGNYGGAFYPTRKAKEQGYDQVLWTDPVQNEFIEESGMMNVIFVINNRLVTPPLSDSILDGITRDSLLTLARHSGYEVQERPISVHELVQAFNDRSISEAFGAGTAAVVAPISTIGIHDRDYLLPGYRQESICNILKTKLQQIQSGVEKDLFEWNTIV